MTLKKAPLKPSSNKGRDTTRNEPTEAALTAAVDQKALDAVALDLRKITDVTNFAIIASGTSTRHVKGIADKISERLSQLGEQPLSVAGYERGEWVLMDYGDLVVHVFFEPTRQFYNLDELWAKAPRLKLPEHLKEHAKQLRTGLYSAPV